MLLVVGLTVADAQAHPVPVAAVAQQEPDSLELCVSGDEAQFWDVGDQINGVFCDVVDDAGHPVLEALGASVLSTPDLTGHDAIRDVWKAI